MMPTMEIPNIDELEHWHFELTESACNQLLDLVLAGRKRATSSSLLSYRMEGEEIPKAGDLSVITDWDGVPRCVVMTTAVRVMRYGDITFDIAKLEGEDGIIDQDYSLNAGRYVGVVIEDDGMTEAEFRETMLGLNAEFDALNSDAKKLEEQNAKKIRGLF